MSQMNYLCLPLIPNEANSCPRCGLAKPSATVVNARDTHGLMSDVTPLIPFVLPLISYIKPIAALLLDYLRIVQYEEGDVVDFPDERDQVRKGVILKTMKLLSSAGGLSPTSWFSSIASTIHFQEGDDVHVLLIRPLGQAKDFDLIIQRDAVRPCIDPCVSRSSRTRKRSWLADDRWVIPSRYGYWRRMWHRQTFETDVLVGKGTASILWKTIDKTWQAKLHASVR